MNTAARVETYLARHGAALVDQVRRSHPALVDRYLERLDSGFLAVQAEREKSFDPCSRDLEEHVLPWMAERGDWPRFVRYLLVACNLRDLSEELDSPVLLRALARERLPFAVNLAGRLPDPLRRARSRAVLVGALRRSGRAQEAVYGELVEALRADLERGDLAPERPEAEAWCATLVEVMQETGLAMRRQWDDWLNLLEPDPDLADRLRLAAAQVLLRDDPEGDEAWRHLAMVRDPDDLVPFLVCRAPRLAALPLGRVLQRLRELDRERGTLFWSTVPAVLARFGEPAAELLAVARSCGPPLRWTPRLATAGTPLWRCLPWPEVRALGDTMDGAETRAAFWTSVLAAGRGPALTPACRAVDVLRQGDARVCRTLCLLEAWPERRSGERCERLQRLGDLLARQRFARPSDELRRFLDLVARLRPGDLHRWVGDVLWGPESDAALLLTLVRASDAEEVLEELLEHPESYAATVAEDEAAGFELRLRVIVETTARLCRRRGDASALDTALERVLPDEEDDLRTAVAAALAGVGRVNAAMTICDGIRSRRTRRRVRLDLVPERAAAQGALAPADLYAAVATVEAVEDELDALSALFEVPVDPGEVAREHLEGIADPRRRLTALADLARHALEFEQRVHPPDRRDPLVALLPLREALGVAESDRWLVRMTPELVELGSAVGGGRALLELKEAVEGVVARTAVPWEERQEVLAALLAGSTDLLLGEEPGRRDEARGAAWLRGLLALPTEFPPGYVERDELRRHWHRLLPRITAAAETAPPAVTQRLRHPLRARLGWVVPGPEGEPARSIGSTLARHRKRWEWLSDDQGEVVRLCVMDPEDRYAAAAAVRARGSAPPMMVEALVVLLAHAGDDGLLDDLLDLLPDAARRDALRLELARFSSLARRRRHRLVATIEDPAVARQARVWVAAAREVAPLAAALAAGDLDVEDPRCEPLRRRLWTTGRVDGALPTLAVAATAALRDGGSAPGLDGLRLWLNARLAPTPGLAHNGEVRQTWAVLRRGVRAAREIGGEASETAEGVDDPPSAPAVERTSVGSQRFAIVHKAWKDAWGRRLRLFAGQRSSRDEAISLFLAVCAAILLLPPLDLTLWAQPPLPSPSTGSSSSTFPWILALLPTALLNGYFLGGCLAWTGAGDESRSRRLRWVVSVLVCVPYWGLLLAGFHRRWLPRLQTVLHRRSSRRPAPPRHRPGLHLRLGLLSRARVVAPLILGNALSPMAFNQWLPAARPVRPGMLVAFLVSVGAVHVTLFLCLLMAAEGRPGFGPEEGPGRTGHRLLAVSFLFPIPGLALVGCLYFVAVSEMTKWPFGELVGGSRRAPRLQRLEQGLRASWSATRGPGVPPAGLFTAPLSSRREMVTAHAAQLKVASLFFVSSEIGRRVPSLPDALGWSLLGAGVSALGWTAASFLFTTWRRSYERGHHCTASYVAAVTLAVCAGLYSGHGVAADDLQAATSVLVFVATLAAAANLATILATGLSGVPERSSVQSRLTLLRMLFFTVVAMLAAGSTSDRFDADAALTALQTAVSLGYLLVVPLASFLAPQRVTRPYGPRNALLGRVPAEDRPAAMFLAWTALLPGGGLAVPLWIPVLRRQVERERRWLLWTDGGWA